MKHAGPAALASLARLIDEIGRLPGVVARKPGIFYRRGQAFLHFHEDEAGLFADVKENGAWTRLDVTAEGDWPVIIARVRRNLPNR